MADMNTLPVELIVSIFEHLDIPSLLGASAVRRSLGLLVFLVK